MLTTNKDTVWFGEDEHCTKLYFRHRRRTCSPQNFGVTCVEDHFV